MHCAVCKGTGRLDAHSTMARDTTQRYGVDQVLMLALVLVLGAGCWVLSSRAGAEHSGYRLSPLSSCRLTVKYGMIGDEVSEQGK